MPSVTLSQLQSRVYSRIDNNTALYTAAELTSAINESIRTTNLVTGYTQTSTSISSVANQVWYSIPTGILVPIRLQFAGTFIERVSVNNIGNNSPNWQMHTTTNVGYPVSQWVTSGLTNFAIHPADSIGGNSIVITGIVEPTLLVSSGDTISIPDEYSEVLEDLSVVALVLKEGGKSFGDILMLRDKAMEKLKKFVRWQTERQPGRSSEMVQTR
jgi:hypothetical protein